MCRDGPSSFRSHKWPASGCLNRSMRATVILVSLCPVKVQTLPIVLSQHAVNLNSFWYSGGHCRSLQLREPVGQYLVCVCVVADAMVDQNGSWVAVGARVRGGEIPVNSFVIW